MNLNEIVNNRLTSKWTKFWLLLVFIFVAPFGIFVVAGWWLKRTNKVQQTQKKYLWLGLVGLLFLAIIWAGNIKDSQSSIQTQDNLKQTAVDKASQNNQVLNTTDQAENLTVAETTPTVELIVTKVVDGDTIELSTGEKVRYIGIDTPETVDPKRSVGCYGKEASDQNEKLVLGKVVTLEKDVSETDKYGRLLRYVYVDGIFVNDYLVRQGYAKASSYPPDVKYQDQFRQAEQEARENERGLWSEACVSPTPTIKALPTAKPTTYPTLRPTTKPQPTLAPVSSSGSSGCNCAKTCTQMSTCEEAYYQLNICGCSERDGDSDGVPCESLCK